MHKAKRPENKSNALGHHALPNLPAPGEVLLATQAPRQCYAAEVVVPRCPRHAAYPSCRGRRVPRVQ
eukprot:12412148-Alexandrium_andersonii.AAC.1